MYYIIMADIVGSGKTSDAKGLSLAFSKLIEGCNSKFSDEILSPLTITLGDEFQGVLKGESAFYKVLSYLEENKWRFSHEIRLRYVLYFGEIDTEINTKIAHGMIGKGLTVARASLAKVKKEKGLFAMGGIEDQMELKEILVHLYLSHIEQWNWRDAELIAAFLKWKDYKIVAECLSKDVSLTWKRQHSLGLNNYYKLKRALALVFCPNETHYT